MSIEGDRNKAGMFSEGEILSATKLNALGDLAGYGKQWHSSGAQVIQGGFGTVQMSEMQYEQYTSDQFSVSVQKENDNYWFTIKPGYVTIRDIYGPMTYDSSTGKAESNYVNGAGIWQDDAMPTPIELGYLGHDQVYYVDTCNAYGEKKGSTKDKTPGAPANKLLDYTFRPDNNADRSIIIFLYRCTPGIGTPKLGVCSWPAFRNYFTNQSTAADPSKVLIGPVTVSGTGAMGSPAVITIYQPYESIVINSTTGPVVIKQVGFVSAPEWASVEGYGLQVQVIAIYDKEDKALLEVNRGHAEMRIAPMVTSRSIPYPVTSSAKFIMNSGWHSYFYTTQGAGGFTGLKFEDAGPRDPKQPPIPRT